MNYDDHIDDRVRYPFIHKSEILKLYNKQTNKQNYAKSTDERQNIIFYEHH